MVNQQRKEHLLGSAVALEILLVPDTLALGLC